MRFFLTGRSRFGRNVLRVARANLLAQALPVLAAPLLTRLYAPADFGALALFASLLGVALAVATFRFDWSVPNARSSAQAAALVAAAFGVLLVLVMLSPVWWWLGRTALPSARDFDLPGGAAWLLPLALLGAGAQQTLQGWHVRSAELGAMGRAKVMQSVANVVVALLAAPFGPIGLIGGTLAGAWVGLGTLWRHAVGLRLALARLTRLRVAVAMRRFGREAAWSTLASALNTASFALVPLLLARHYSLAEVGYYALMQRVALGPIGLVGAAVSQSFWAEAARLVRDDPRGLAALYRRSSSRLAILALPVAALGLAGPWFIGPLFGMGVWAAAGAVLAASVPMLVGQAVVSPLSHLIIHRRQHWQALWDLARVFLLALTIEASGQLRASFVVAVLGVSLVMAAMYGVLMALNQRALRDAVRARG